jgi:hypothetical protein
MKFMQTLRIIALTATLLAPLPLAAQTMQWSSQSMPESATAYGIDPMIRIAVTFRAPLQPMPADIESDSAMLEKARRALYAQAQKECAILAETFPKSECRLGGLQFNTGIVLPNNPQPPSLSATATYFLKTK